MDRYWAVRKSTAAQQELMGVWLKHVLPESREKYMRGEEVSPGATFSQIIRSR